MTKVPVPENEATRLAALHRYQILDTTPEKAFDGLVRLACYIFNTPIALVTLVDSERQWFKAKVGLDVPETSRDVSFCAHAITRPDEVMIVPDTLDDNRFAANPFVLSNPNIRFYAGSPLVTEDGFALGTLCVIDKVPRTLTPEQVEMLQILSQRVIAELELRRDIGRLRDEILAREKAEIALSQQIKTLATLYKASHQISEKLELESIYQVAHQATAQLMPARVFVISLLDEAVQEVEDVYLFDSGGRWPNRRHPLLKGHGISSTVIATAATLRLDDWDEVTAESLGAEVFGDGIDTRSHLAVPLQTNGKVIGAIGVQDYKANIYTEEHEQILHTIANQVAVAIANAKLIQTILEDEQRFRTLVENIPEIFWLSDPNLGKIIYVSPAYEKIWGRSRESLYKNGRSYLDAVHPEDKAQVEVAQLEKGLIRDAVEFRIIQPDGSLRWVTAQAFPILDEKGIAHLVVGIASDITERIQAEQIAARLAAIVNSSQDAIIGKTMSGIVVDWNSGAEKLYGYAASEIINHSISILVPPDRPDEVPQLLDRIRLGESVETFETERLTKGGQLVPVFLSISPIKNGTGQIIGASTIARDITERKSLEKLRDDLTHMIVHDLRNPLAGIMLAIDSLEAEPLKPEQREFAEIAMDSTKYMLELVNTILDVSRLESGQMPLDRTPVILGSLIAQSLEIQHTLANSKNIRLVNQVPASLPPVLIDAGLIGRVFQNLVDNAIKFTPKAGEIQISAQQDLNEPSMIRVMVTDTGPGIPKELQYKLFQKYITGRNIGRGSGLGLVFCRLVVEAHGGRIWVESIGDHGTTFTFLLPFLPE